MQYATPLTVLPDDVQACPCRPGILEHSTSFVDDTPVLDQRFCLPHALPVSIPCYQEAATLSVTTASLIWSVL